MNERSKSTLFLMEQIIVITVFAICAAACVRIFVESFLITVESVDIKNALLVAESAAESFKATVGDTERTAEILSGRVGDFSDSTVSIYYDSYWQPTALLKDASFMLHFTKQDTGSPVITGEVIINKITDEEPLELVILQVGVRRGE